jgi:hypothetical protein
MKQSVLTIILLIVLAFFTQCDKTEIGRKIYKTGETLEISNSEPGYIVGGSGFDTLKIDVVKIMDSRCPKGAVCFWAGEAHLELVAKMGQLRSDTIFASVGIGAVNKYKNPAEFKLGNSKFRVTINDVLPYPGTNNSLQGKSVSMLLTQID